MQKETTGPWLPVLLDQKIQRAGLGAELHLAMGTMAMPMSEPGARAEHSYNPSSLQTFFPAPPLPVQHCPAVLTAPLLGSSEQGEDKLRNSPWGSAGHPSTFLLPKHSADPQPVQDCPSHLPGWEENESSRSQQGILIL